MVADPEALQGNGIEHLCGAPGRGEGGKKIVRQTVRSDAVDQYFDAHPAQLRSEQGFAEASAQVVIGEDVGFEPDGSPRCVDRCQHGGKSFIAIAQPLPRGDSG